jgi:hypothetical protein
MRITVRDMPAAFVHGVPETWRIWDAIIGESVRDDAIALALPGAGERQKSPQSSSTQGRALPDEAVTDITVSREA